MKKIEKEENAYCSNGCLILIIGFIGIIALVISGTIICMYIINCFSK
jgi:uncharacterized membrane protein YbaN (DUF454 family)